MTSKKTLVECLVGKMFTLGSDQKQDLTIALKATRYIGDPQLVDISGYCAHMRRIRREQERIPEIQEGYPHITQRSG